MANIDTSLLIAALEAQIASQAASGVSSYSIGSRSVTREKITEQIAALKALQSLEDRQQNGIMRVAKMRRPRA